MRCPRCDLGLEIIGSSGETGPEVAGSCEPAPRPRTIVVTHDEKSEHGTRAHYRMEIPLPRSIKWEGDSVVIRDQHGLRHCLSDATVELYGG